MHDRSILKPIDIAIFKAKESAARLQNAHKHSIRSGASKEAQRVSAQQAEEYVVDLEKTRAAVLDLLQESASLERDWFMCCHPAWPDPLRIWPRGEENAARTIREHPNPQAYLISELKGGRVEYKGADLAKFLEAHP